MPYPEALVKPMRAELTELGVTELKDAAAVDAAFADAQDSTMLLVINSVCGCAAANARPAVARAMQHETQPDHYVTVFAGQDTEATERARAKYLAGIPPSSPFLALFKDGTPVHVIERRGIEGRSAEAIAADLTEAFDAHCEPASEGKGGGATPSSSEQPQEGNGATDLPPTFRSIKNR